MDLRRQGSGVRRRVRLDRLRLSGRTDAFQHGPSVLTNFHTEEEKEAFRKVPSLAGARPSATFPSRPGVPISASSTWPDSRRTATGCTRPAGVRTCRWSTSCRTGPGPTGIGQVTPVHVYTTGDERRTFSSTASPRGSRKRKVTASAGTMSFTSPEPSRSSPTRMDSPGQRPKRQRPESLPRLRWRSILAEKN